MTQNTALILSLTNTLLSLQINIVSQAEIAQDTLYNQRKIRDKNSLSFSNFLKYGKKEYDKFIKYNGSIPVIVLLLDWEGNNRGT